MAYQPDAASSQFFTFLSKQKYQRQLFDLVREKGLLQHSATIEIPPVFQNTVEWLQETKNQLMLTTFPNPIFICGFTAALLYTTNDLLITSYYHWMLNYLYCHIGNLPGESKELID